MLEAADPSNVQEPLRAAIDQAGGPVAAAEACGVSPRALYKWLERGRLPRTEYSGETNYAERIASLARARGHELDASQLLDQLKGAA